MINVKTGAQKHTKEPKMHRTQVLLSPDQYQQLANLAHKEHQSLSGVVRELLDEALRAQTHAELEKAAQMMAQAYETDKELTAFSVLDGEDFIA